MSGTYNVLLFLHIVAVVVTFAPIVVNPMVERALAKVPATERRPVYEFMTRSLQRVHLTALLLVGVFGIGLVSTSDDAWEFSQTWVGLALLLWIAIGGVMSAVMVPAMRKRADGDDSAEQRIALGGTIVSVLFLIVLYLMIWKPGV